MKIVARLRKVVKLALADEQYDSHVAELEYKFSDIADEAKTNIDGINDVETGEEYLDKIEEYRSKLGAAQHYLEDLRKFYSLKSGPRYRRYMLIRDQFTDLASTVSTMRDMIDVNRKQIAKRLVSRAPARRTISDMASGSYESAITNAFDVHVNPIGMESGIRMMEYRSGGFSDEFIRRLKVLGLFDDSVEKELKKAEDGIFEGASKRASDVFGSFVSSHFSTWGG